MPAVVIPVRFKGFGQQRLPRREGETKSRALTRAADSLQTFMRSPQGGIPKKSGRLRRNTVVTTRPFSHIVLSNRTPYASYVERQKAPFKRGIGRWRQRQGRGR